MPLGGSTNTKDIAVTPFRKTHAWFDLNEGFISEPNISFGRPARAMFLQSEIANKSLLFRGGGWSIRAYHQDLSLLSERTEVSTADWLTPANGNILVASGFTTVNLNRAPSATEMPGATTGASASLATTNYPWIKKAVTAGTNWSTLNLSADQTAFPFDGVDNDYSIDSTIAVDRIAKSVDNDSEERDIHLAIISYGSTQDSPRTLWRFYFNGPAGTNDNGIGIGQYCLVGLGNRRAVLFEKCPLNTPKWVKRLEFADIVNSGVSISSSRTFINIHKPTICWADGKRNGTLEFVYLSSPDTASMEHTNFTLLQQLTMVADSAMRPANSSPQWKKVVYRIPGERRAATLAPLRVDLRRDVMGFIGLAWHKYPTNVITVDDSPFETNYYPSTEQNFHLYWKDCLPGTCEIDCSLHRADTGAELTIVASASHHKEYECPEHVKRYFVRFTIQSDGQYTPTIKGYEVKRTGVIRSPGIPSWEIGDATHPKSVIRKVSIRGAERDLSHQLATLEIADPLDTLTELKIRAGMPIRIETEYDSADPSKRCILFRGQVDQALAQRMKSAEENQQYPKTGWNKFSVTAHGVWQLLDDNFVGTPIFSLSDPITGDPYKVTDVIKNLISGGGFDVTTDFDFPDLPTRIYASDLDFSQNIDMLEKISDVVKSLARDYLAHFLIYDENVAKWRLIEPPIAPYTNLVEFTTTGPSSPPKLAYYLPSYSSSSPPKVPAKEVRQYTKKPECNWLNVTSVGAWNSEAPYVYSVNIFNPLSFDFNGAATSDPTSPDYLGRLKPAWVIDPALGSAHDLDALKAATNALARRIEKLSMHGVPIVTVEAPLAIVTHESDATKRRILRYYDPVLYNGVQYLVRNVNPTYEHDGIQMAMYELEKPQA